MLTCPPLLHFAGPIKRQRPVGPVLNPECQLQGPDKHLKPRVLCLHGLLPVWLWLSRAPTSPSSRITAKKRRMDTPSRLWGGSQGPALVTPQGRKGCSPASGGRGQEVLLVRPRGPGPEHSSHRQPGSPSGFTVTEMDGAGQESTRNPKKTGLAWNPRNNVTPPHTAPEQSRPPWVALGLFASISPATVHPTHKRLASSPGPFLPSSPDHLKGKRQVGVPPSPHFAIRLPPDL